MTKTPRRAAKKSKGRRRVFGGRYAYVKPLGRGAGGSVYLAEDLHRQRRKVALKVLTAEAGRGVQGKMLRREFTILSKLDHPNLVDVYDYGELPDGGVYLAEEYIEGFSLQDARALLEPGALVHVTFQILVALSYLHGMGMIHRDIKPANVMLLWLEDSGARPMVKLVDFGLSSMDPERDTLRGGTRSYMAPEIIRGKKGELRSDLYSLGVTLYYVMCGVLPFGPRKKGDPPPTEESFRPPEPHRLNPDVPLVMSRFTMGLLRQVHHLAWADAAEALQELLRDSEMVEAWTGGAKANALDVAASPLMRGYFKRGILRRREQEHRRLVKAMRDGEESSIGRMRLIAGEDGVGKSRLLSEVGASCKLAGRLVISQVCEPGMKPYQLVHRLLSRVVEIGESRGIEQIEHYRSHLLILARMARLERKVDAEVPGDPVWIQEAFEDAVVMLHPQQVTLLVEDLHLADAASLRLVEAWFASSQAFHRPDLVATVRQGEVELRLGQGAEVEVTQLDGLSRSDVFRFFRERLGVEDVASEWLSRVAELARGRPAYLEQLSQGLIDQGVLRRKSVQEWSLEREALSRFRPPRDVAESFERRLAGVSAVGREALEVLSLHGRPLRWLDLRALLVEGGAEQEVADQTLNALVWRNLTRLDLSMDGRRVSLVHDVLAEVVLELAQSDWQRALHRRIGQYFESHWQQPFAPPLDTARHLQAGGENEEAAEFYEIAGDRAWAERDFGLALTCFRRGAEAAEQGASRAFVTMKLARALLAVYDPDPCLRALRQAAEYAEQSARPWVMYAVTLTAGNIALSLGHLAEAEVWLERLQRILPATRAQADVIELESRLLARQGALDQATQRMQACVEHAIRFGNPEGHVAALARHAGLLALKGRTGEARDIFQQALLLADELGSGVMRGRVLAAYGKALRWAGFVNTAVDMLSDALDILGNGNYPDAWVRALYEIAICHATAGDTTRAGQFAADAQIFARELGDRFLEELVVFVKAEIKCIEADSQGEALDEMGRALRALDELRADARDTAEVWLRYGVCLANAGRVEARTVMEGALARSQELGSELLIGRVRQAMRQHGWSS